MPETVVIRCNSKTGKKDLEDLSRRLKTIGHDPDLEDEFKEMTDESVLGHHYNELTSPHDELFYNPLDDEYTPPKITRSRVQRAVRIESRLMEMEYSSAHSN